MERPMNGKAHEIRPRAARPASTHFSPTQDSTTLARCGIVDAMLRMVDFLRFFSLFGIFVLAAAAQSPASAPIVLHAARLLQVDTGTMLQPGEILIVGEGLSRRGLFSRTSEI